MVRIGGAVVACVVLAWLTAARVHVWGDERALWQEAVARAPLKPRPWINLGNQFRLRGSDGLAEYCYRQAIAVAVDRPPVERDASTRIAEANLARLHVDLEAWLRAPE